MTRFCSFFSFLSVFVCVFVSGHHILSWWPIRLITLANNSSRSNTCANPLTGRQCPRRHIVFFPFRFLFHRHTWLPFPLSFSFFWNHSPLNMSRIQCFEERKKKPNKHNQFNSEPPGFNDWLIFVNIFGDLPVALERWRDRRPATPLR